MEDFKSTVPRTKAERARRRDADAADLAEWEQRFVEALCAALAPRAAELARLMDEER
jgi:hypothetical protein